MSSLETLGLGVVGAGYWGKNIVRNFTRLKRAELRWVADLSETNRDRARTLAPNAQVTADYEAMLSSSDVDAVAVCTPAASHYELTLAALQAGKHVFVEKPLTLEGAHADELVDLAEERGLTLMVGHLMIHHPAIRWIKDQIQSGEIGDLHYLYCQRVNLGVVRSDESAWWSLAPHDLSIILHLLDSSPVTISARGAAYLRPEIEDVVFANVKFEGGQMAEVHTSWLDPHKSRLLTLVGSRRMVTFDDTAPREKVRVYDKGAERTVDYQTYADLITLRQGDIWIPSIQGTEPLLLECQHFVDCIREGRTPDTPGTQGRDVVRILQAGQQSMDSDGAPISLLS
ncbi:MAG: Gfo/Idh/MocA family oxidoreductase [Deltaproteobacteria bacterium]|nr:Gfo/Idh/MocA family oxidoreductase [Deltaproteobacteria bacterium]